MDLTSRRFALLGVWLTIVAIAAGGAIAPPAHPHAGPGQPALAAGGPDGNSTCEICPGQPASRDSGDGEEIAKRGEARTLLAVSPSTRLPIGARPKAAGSLVMDKPQADRDVLLALERSAATSSTACLPLLRSTHLRI